jgi:hypothetical protein
VDLAKMELFKTMTSEKLTRYYLIHQLSMHAWDIQLLRIMLALQIMKASKKYVAETISPLQEHDQQVMALSHKKGILPVSG